MDKIKNSIILVTGGAGFIGSNLVDSLIEDNEIVVVDDLSMGKIENLPKSNHLHFFEHSITDEEYMTKLLLDWKFDYIFLLAAVASVADTIERPLQTHRVNQNANINILETIRINKLPLKKLLFASSAAVYGNNPELPKKENSMIDPLSPYAVDKYATERFVINYGKLYGIPVVCTRFFNVYGPKQNPESPYSGVLSLIRKAVKNNESFTVFGDGKQERDFVYVTDVIKALQLLMLNDVAIDDVFNVATGIATDLNTVIKQISNSLNEKINIIYENQRKGDIQNSQASIEKLKKVTNFVPEFSLKDGLESYFKE